MQTPAPPLRLQIVPPGPGGVHDFAVALRDAWARQGCASALLPLDHGAARTQSLADRLTGMLSGRLALAPATPTAQQRCSVLLHFSGYGYDPRGLCGWLLKELRNAQRQLGPQLRIVTLFHELFASGRPWQSAFWLQPLQAGIAGRLAALSAALATNTAQHAQWLRAQQGVTGRLQVRPVFSNFAPPLRLPTLAAREPALIVFGSATTRARALRRLAAHTQTLQALGIEVISEVGPGTLSIDLKQRWQHQHLGLLPPAEVAQQLLRHRFALIDYPAPYLAKSSVLAAYAAHGNAVLNTAAAAPDADGLHAGQHYTSLVGAQQQPLGADGLQSMANTLNGWHGCHPLPLQARELGNLLDPT